MSGLPVWPLFAFLVTLFTFNMRASASDVLRSPNGKLQAKIDLPHWSLSFQGRELAKDCGGRTPGYSAANVYRSMLVDGTTDSVSDGLVRDEHEPSDSVFPFLAAPDASPAAAGAYQ